MKNILEKKGIAIRFVLLLIVGILALAAIFIFLYKADILQYIKALPGYSQPDDEDVGGGDAFIECAQKCENIGGSCFESKGNAPGFFVGRWDCKKGERCFVTKQSFDSNLLTSFGFGYSAEIGGGTYINFLKSSIVKVEFGKPGIFSFESEYKKPVCYLLESNRRAIGEDYFKEDRRFTGSKAFTFSPLDSKILFIVWDPETKKSVVQRTFIAKIKLIGKEFRGGEIIENEEFKKKITSGKKGDVFYVLGMEYEWAKGGGWFTTTYNYRIEHLGNKVVIQVQVPGEGWRNLDCNFWWGAYAIDVKKVKDSLKTTLALCKW